MAAALRPRVLPRTPKKERRRSMSLEAKVDPARRTFVLVHGAWHGGWCWTRVASRLRALGHQVFTPTLTGLGERAHLSGPGVDLSVHVEDVVALLRCEELQDVVLCGHSYGGLVITGVAAQAGAALRGVVYLDAFVPPDGQSLLQSLPDLAPDRRAEAARSFLARNAAALTAGERERIAGETLAILDEPQFAALFAPGSRAEASFAKTAIPANISDASASRLALRR